MTVKYKTLIEWDSLILVVICEHLKSNKKWEYAGKRKSWMFGLFYTQRMKKEFPNG
jgi:hypothetical protein